MIYAIGFLIDGGKGVMSTTQAFRAHSANRNGQVDPLTEYLSGVAGRAANYAATFGASEEAEVMGYLHDLGKYGDLFQRRLDGKEHGIDHWSLGAWIALTIRRGRWSFESRCANPEQTQ